MFTSSSFPFRARSTRPRTRFARWAISSDIPIAPRRRSPGWTLRSRGRDEAVTGKHYPGAAAVAARLGIRQRQPGQFAARPRPGYVNAAGDLGVDFGGYASLEAIVSAEAGFHPGVGRRRPCRGRRPRLSAASRAANVSIRRASASSSRTELTECGSVLLADALDGLVQELQPGRAVRPSSPRPSALIRSPDGAQRNRVRREGPGLRPLDARRRRCS